MAIDVIPLETVGMMSVAGAAEAKGVAERTLQKWILDGLLPVVVAGGGMRTVYLLRVRDVEKFTPPPRGRPRQTAGVVKVTGKTGFPGTTAGAVRVKGSAGNKSPRKPARRK